ncbi:MAG TPA: hypothetical protein VG871_11505, partial [Vicinamibacterales bacterium]|nr:hypothetical protein [Vicinamibacterales bacterium]
MPISGLMIAGNAIIIQTALIAASYLYYAHRGRHVAYWPLRSAALFALTALVTGLQFVFPAVLSLFRRDLDGLRAGEWWRLVTPLFVQPAGTSQVLANAFFLATFLPI